MDEENEPLIIDIGSGNLKAGFASDDQPKHWIPMVIGKPISKGALVGMDQKDCYIGNEVAAKKNVLAIEHPVKEGLIKDMDGICEILNHLYNNDLRRTPEDHKLLITEPPNNDNKIREELVKRLFEEYKVPKLYLGN